LNHTSFASNVANVALSPLGFGTTNTGAPANRARLRPGPRSTPRPSTIGASVIPTSASYALQSLGVDPGDVFAGRGVN